MPKILIVDDNARELDNLARIVGIGNREILKAYSKKEAIHLIEKNDFDVIIIDISLNSEGEDVEGLEVLKFAKDKDILTQVITVTSFGNTELNVKTISLGGFGYLDRQFTPNFSEVLDQKTTQALENRDKEEKGISNNEPGRS
jgi:two-component system, NtrC family, response regulator HydG